MHGAAADRDHLQTAAQLQRDLIRILRQNGECPRTDIAEPDMTAPTGAAPSTPAEEKAEKPAKKPSKKAKAEDVAEADA